MRIQFVDLWQAGILGLALIVGPSVAAAENEGRADLDRAIEIQLTGEGKAGLSRVIELCENALAKGLDQENEKLCRQLLVSTLLERAEMVGGIRRKFFDLRPIKTVDLPAAVKDVERAAEIAPEQPAAPLMLAKLHLTAEGDREKALNALDEAVRLAKNEEEILHEALALRGQFHLRQNKAEQAAADFDAALKLDPNDLAVHFDRATALLALHRYKEARESLGRCLEARPGDRLLLLNAAWASAAAGDYRQALDDANRLLAIDPDGPAGLLLRAASLAQLERAQEALPDVNRALALQPDSDYAISLWAMITQKAGRARIAIKELRGQVETNPEDAVAWLQLGLLYHAQRRLGKAIDSYSAAIERRQHRGFAHRLRGDIYLSTGMRKEAILDYKDALEFDQNNSGALNNLAWLLATSPEPELRDGAKSLELALKACDLTNHRQAHILSTLAAAYAETGDFEAARTWSKKSVETADESLKEQLRKELASYEKDEPWRDSQNPSQDDDTPD